jgi:hypothetical protein
MWPAKSSSTNPALVSSVRVIPGLIARHLFRAAVCCGLAQPTSRNAQVIMDSSFICVMPSNEKS